MKKTNLARLCLATVLSLVNLSCWDEEKKEMEVATTLVAGSEENKRAYVTLVPKDEEYRFPTEYFMVRSPGLCDLIKEDFDKDPNGVVVYDSTRDGPWTANQFKELFEGVNRTYREYWSKKLSEKDKSKN